jgi:hypothetical protein
MAHVSPFEFARAVQSTCDRSDLVAAYDVQILDDTVVKVQVSLTYDAFIDVFFNTDTEKCSYALIEKAARIFGADNAFIGWHIHPFDDPSQHVPSPEISFLDFLKMVEEYVAKRQE